MAETALEWKPWKISLQRSPIFLYSDYFWPSYHGNKNIRQKRRIRLKCHHQNPPHTVKISDVDEPGDWDCARMKARKKYLLNGHQFVDIPTIFYKVTMEVRIKDKIEEFD